MNVFEAVKQSVSTREVAEMYGIKVRRNGMACCPFHDDRNPSMKLDNRFHCFGCGADGDAIDFVAKLYGLSLKEAAVKIADDFGISYNLKHKASVRARIREPTDMEKVRKEKQHCMTVLSDYRRLLLEWERTCSPVTLDEEWNPLFVEALPSVDKGKYAFQRPKQPLILSLPLACASKPSSASASAPIFACWKVLRSFSESETAAQRG